jgi:hypothetical protein
MIAVKWVTAFKPKKKRLASTRHRPQRTSSLFAVTADLLGKLVESRFEIGGESYGCETTEN